MWSFDHSRQCDSKTKWIILFNRSSKIYYLYKNKQLKLVDEDDFDIICLIRTRFTLKRTRWLFGTQEFFLKKTKLNKSFKIAGNQVKMFAQNCWIKRASFIQLSNLLIWWVLNLAWNVCPHC